MNYKEDPIFSSTVVQDVSSQPPIDEQIQPVVLTNENLPGSDLTSPFNFNDSNVDDASGCPNDAWIVEFLQGLDHDQESTMLLDEKFLDSLDPQAPLEQSDSGLDQDEILEDTAEQSNAGVHQEQVLGDVAEQSDSSIDQAEILEDTAEQQTVVVKSSNTEPHVNFRNSPDWVVFSEQLKFLVVPEVYQRARYEKELNDDLRYITVANDGSITLAMPDSLNHLPPGVSPYMRITRTTTPCGPDNIMCCHPYPLWVKDARATVHHGSLFVPIGEQDRANLLIKFEHLIMQRLKQSPLKQIKQWPIYKHDQLDCDGFHPIDMKKAKRTISENNLRYSILHFQVFLVDQNQLAYATDLQCQTDSIYEYEWKELKSLPANVALSAKRATKRLQRTPKASTVKKSRKMAKNIKEA